jgi:hypothetical protein
VLVAGGGAGLLPYRATLSWLGAASDDPTQRHPSRLPAALQFSRHAELFLHTFHAAPPGVEIGFPLALTGKELTFPPELTAQARYHAFLGEGRFVGTFHVHPPDRPPFFDPGDLAALLRSDNAGFVDVLLKRDRLYAAVRANPYLYISAHHVNRNPLLLAEEHAARVRRQGSRSPADPDYAQHYRRAGLYHFQRYHLALYEGDPQGELRRTFTPSDSW